MPTKSETRAAALVEITRLERSLADLIREVFRTRTVVCGPRCRGWFVNGETFAIERCDECALRNGYAEVVHDDIIATLPEAQRTAAGLRASKRRARERSLARMGVAS